MWNITLAHLVQSKQLWWNSGVLVGSRLWCEGAKHTTRLPKRMHVTCYSEYHEPIKSVWLKQTAELRTGGTGGHSLTLTKVEVWLKNHLNAKEAGKVPLRWPRHRTESLCFRCSLWAGTGVCVAQSAKNVGKHLKGNKVGCFGDRNQLHPSMRTIASFICSPLRSKSFRSRSRFGKMVPYGLHTLEKILWGSSVMGWISPQDLKSCPLGSNSLSAERRPLSVH